MVQWHAFVIMVMNLQVPQDAAEKWKKWGIIKHDN
jgi:hypothetical protein